MAVGSPTRARPRARPVWPGGRGRAPRRRTPTSSAYDADPEASTSRKARRAGSKSSSASGTTRCSTGSTLVVKSPGCPAQAPPVAAARARGIPVISRDRARRPAARQPDPRRDGTNGKTTTTALLGAMFARRRRACRGRRQHRPAADEPRRSGRDPTRGSSASSRRSSSRTSTRFTPGSRCCSTSSRTTSTATAASTRTRDAKLRIFENQSADDVAIVPARLRRRSRARRRRIEFAVDDPLPAEPLIPGAHNRENAAAATAAARAAGIPDEAIAEALRTFPGSSTGSRRSATIARRALRQRLEGDERRCCAARARVVRRGAQARDPRRPWQGRAVRAARGGIRHRTTAPT